MSVDYNKVSSSQLFRLWLIAKRYGVPYDKLIDHIHATTPVKLVDEMTQEQYQNVYRWIFKGEHK